MRKRLIGSMVLMLILFIITLVFTELNVSTCRYLYIELSSPGTVATDMYSNTITSLYFAGQTTFFIVTIACVVLISG